MILLGILLAGSHVVFLVLIVSWFSLRKPTSWAMARTRFHEAWRR
jgi:hypothetical protein